MPIYDSTIREHHNWIGDAQRVAAYEEALGELIRPDHIVLDLGSGTGMMALLACRAGAKRVYSIESEAVIALAREIAILNGFEPRINFVRGLSTDIDLPEPVDLVVADQFGLMALESGRLIPSFTDARRRFLKPGGILVPSRVNLLFAPVEDSESWDQVQLWTRSPAGFDFSPARRYAINSLFPARTTAEQLLATPSVGATVDLSEAEITVVRCSAEVVVERSGVMHGVAAAFSAQLSPTSYITNSPCDTRKLNRRNAFLPIEEPVRLTAGDCVQMTVYVLPDEFVAWEVQVQGANSPTSQHIRHCTVFGEPRCLEDVERLGPDATPSISRLGEACRIVLQLCDGCSQLSVIEREIMRRFPERFPSQSEAAIFVAAIVAKFTSIGC